METETGGVEKEVRMTLPLARGRNVGVHTSGGREWKSSFSVGVMSWAYCV